MDIDACTWYSLHNFIRGHEEVPSFGGDVHARILWLETFSGCIDRLCGCDRRKPGCGYLSLGREPWCIWLHLQEGRTLLDASHQRHPSAPWVEPTASRQ